MSFINLNLRFETPAAYRAWLFSHPKPTWGVVSWRCDAEYGIIEETNKPPRCVNSRGRDQQRWRLPMSSSIPRVAGVYRIRCIPTSKVYIGSAIHIPKRWAEHRSHLRSGCHKSRYLQRAWDKYGEAQFEFSVLEYVMFTEELREREQVWMDRTKCYTRSKGFNSCRFAGTTTGLKASDETRAKMRAASKGKPKSPEHARRIGEATAHEWLIIDPEGKEFIIRNLQAFCREHGLDQGRMHKIADGKPKCKTCKGYSCRRISKPRNKRDI